MMKSPIVHQSLYRCMIGSLLYLTASRPNAMQAVCMVKIFQDSLKEPHPKVVK